MVEVVLNRHLAAGGLLRSKNEYRDGVSGKSMGKEEAGHMSIELVSEIPSQYSKKRIDTEPQGQAKVVHHR